MLLTTRPTCINGHYYLEKSEYKEEFSDHMIKYFKTVKWEV